MDPPAPRGVHFAFEVSSRAPCDWSGGCAKRFGVRLSISWLLVRLRSDHRERRKTMKYTLLIYQGSTPTPDDPEAWATLSPDAQQAVYSAYQALNQTPGLQPGTPMAPPEMATTVRVQDGKTLTTDGPFAEVKEAIGGFFTFEADDLDAAIELASRVPAARLGGAIEIRPQREGY